MFLEAEGGTTVTFPEAISSNRIRFCNWLARKTRPSGVTAIPEGSSVGVEAQSEKTVRAILTFEAKCEELSNWLLPGWETQFAGAGVAASET